MPPPGARAGAGAPASRPTWNALTIVFGELEDAYDTRRQHQNDIGLSPFVAGLWPKSWPTPGISLKPGMPFRTLPFVVADEAGQHVRLAVFQTESSF